VGEQPGGAHVQGRFVALTYNLVALYERRIEEEHDIHNRPEDQRRAKRLSTLKRSPRPPDEPCPACCKQAGMPPSEA
jgi:hypothetical protein